MKDLMFQLLVIAGLYALMFSIAPDSPELNLMVGKAPLAKKELPPVKNVLQVSVKTNISNKTSVLNSERKDSFSSSVPAFAYAKAFPVPVNLVKKQLPIINTAPSNHFQIINETSLRDFPDAQGGVLNRLTEGTVVKVLENEDYFWWKVDYAGRVGWVKRLLLKQA